MKFRVRVVEGQLKVEKQDAAPSHEGSQSKGEIDSSGGRADDKPEDRSARIRKALDGPSPSELIH